MVKLWFAKVRPDGIIPSKRDEDAGYDIFLAFDGEYIRLEPHETKLLPTGIASAFEPGYYFQIQERGSTGSRGIGKRCGVIDSGYRGGMVRAHDKPEHRPAVLCKGIGRGIPGGAEGAGRALQRILHNKGGVPGGAAAGAGDGNNRDTL